MEEFSRGRPEGSPSDPGEGGAAIRTPSKGDSSSSGSVTRPAPSSDSPTLIDIPAPSHSDPSDSPTRVDIPGGTGSDPSDSPTLVGHAPDFGPDSPTMIGSGPWPAAPTPTPRAQKSPSNPSMLQPGAVLGQRYEILEILGEGGMGAVYKARDLELNRMVALKVIRPELAGSQAIIDRFKQELLLATQVTHKNVIRIYDLSEAEGMKFITMEYVEGEDLRGLMQQKKKLAPEEAVEIMLQVCRALEAAHSVGIIHRDLKPQNIMRDKAGRILVMDFGLARTLEGDGMTQTGALVGTMDYMSPEQALGKDLDQRSDLFTLGLIFYELLTGKMPYKADSVVASLLKRTHPAPPQRHRRQVHGSRRQTSLREFQPDHGRSGSLAGRTCRSDAELPQQRPALGTNHSLALDRRSCNGTCAGAHRVSAARPAIQTHERPIRPGRFARHSAVPQRFRRSRPGLDRRQPCRNSGHRYRAVGAIPCGSS